MTTAILKTTNNKYIGTIREEVKNDSYYMKGGFYCKLLKNGKSFGKSCFFTLDKIEIL
jgi:hypothetical protein